MVRVSKLLLFYHPVDFEGSTCSGTPCFQSTLLIPSPGFLDTFVVYTVETSHISTNICARGFEIFRDAPRARVGPNRSRPVFDQLGHFRKMFIFRSFCSLQGPWGAWKHKICWKAPNLF